MFLFDSQEMQFLLNKPKNFAKKTNFKQCVQIFGE